MFYGYRILKPKVQCICNLDHTSRWSAVSGSKYLTCISHIASEYSQLLLCDMSSNYFEFIREYIIK